jgi:hypothetical protein
LPVESGEKKERNCETTSYAKVLGERASLHEYPLIPLIFVALKQRKIDGATANLRRVLSNDKVKSKCRVRPRRVSTRAALASQSLRRQAPSTILPVRLALLDQRAQPFLRIFKLVELVEKNIHRLHEPVT